MAGIDKVPHRIPDEWSAEWFARFIREVLSLADVRNANAGAGIHIDGTPDRPATISASAGIDQLVNANYVVAEPQSFLPSARLLSAETGVIELHDTGPGGSLVVGIPDHGLHANKLRLASARSVLGNPEASEGGLMDIAAGTDETVLARVSGALEFSQLTSGMAPDGLWVYAKLQPVSATSRILGRVSSGAGVIEELTGTQATGLLDVFTSSLKGIVPASGGGTDNFLRADGTWAMPASTTIDVYATPGTHSWTKPAGARLIEVICIGAGGGGGSGRKRATGSAGSGGSGGGAGGVSRVRMPSAAVSGSVTVTVGASGSGASATSSDSTDGSAGGAGGASSFGSYLSSGGGGAGGAGAATSAAAPGAGGSGNWENGSAGGVGDDDTSNAAGGDTTFAPSGGGGGGGVTAANAESAGKAGGVISCASKSGGAGGAVGGNAGGAGDNTNSSAGVPGSGGGGGGGNSTANGNGGAGASGAAPGGGGGGGASATNGTGTSGAGGAGGNGMVIVMTYF